MSSASFLPLLSLLVFPVGGHATDSHTEGQHEAEGAWEVDRDRAEVELFQLETDEGTWISVDVSPDGTRIAFDLLGHLWEMDIEGGEATALTSGRSWNMFPRYSPDGSRLAFTSDRGGSNDLWVLELASGELENVSKMDWPVFQGTWSRDGRSLYGTALNMKVRFPLYRFSLQGGKQELLPAGERTPVDHFQEHPDGTLAYYEHNDASLPTSGARIKTWDLETGAIEVAIERPGGACSPRLSPDGKHLAYVHRDDQTTQLVVRELATKQDRVLYSGLDRDRLESRSFYGAAPNLAWTPAGDEVVLSFGGKIHAVSVADASVRPIPFSAQVERRLDRTHRSRVEVPAGESRTQAHRWAMPVEGGVVFEALGDLYHKQEDGELINLTRSAAHETAPVFHAASESLFWASWNDDELGSIQTRRLRGPTPKALTSVPAQYGALSVAPSGRKVAYLRSASGARSGVRLEEETAFELCTVDQYGKERVVTEVAWSRNRYAKRPPTVRFDPEDESILYYTAFEDDALVLHRIREDGGDELPLARFPHATRAVLSPGLDWVVFREYHRNYLAPFQFVGKVLSLTADSGEAKAHRVHPEDGDFTEWTDDGQSLYWTRGTRYVEKTLEAILAGEEEVRTVELSMPYQVATPRTAHLFQGARLLTMDGEDRVLEDTDLLVEGSRITRIGKDLPVPEGAKVWDASALTLMPGMFDAHGHYGSPISALNVIEQRLYGLHANLAYGVTTMFDVYGTTQKDFWVADMLRAGKIRGPRIFSVGDPIFGTKYRTKMHRSIESLEDAREHARFNKDHGATALKCYSNHRREARQMLIQACREEGLNLVAESFADPWMCLSMLVDGYTGIEHTLGLTPLYRDVVSLVAATEVGITPTLIVVYNGPAGERYFHQEARLWEDAKLLHFYTQDQLMRYRRPTHYFEDDWYHDDMAAEMLELHRAGVLLQMGAHGQMMGLGAHWEMEMLVHGGFEPLEAIRVATINGFRHHGLDHELGSLEEGKLADLVVLEENPLEDIRSTRSIRWVMKNGLVYSGADAARVEPTAIPYEPLYFMPKD